MNKKTFFTVVSASLLTFVWLLSGCATLTQDITDGKLFSVYGAYKHLYDPTIPIEEHCYLVNLSFGGFIRDINGLGERVLHKDKEPPMSMDIERWDIAILLPGKYTFDAFWKIDRSSSNYTHVETAKATINFTFEPGQYYFFDTTPSGNSVQFIIANLTSVNEIQMIRGMKPEMIPTKMIIAGMNTAIEKFIQNANYERCTYVTFDENIPVEQQALLLIPGKRLDVKRFSGKRVKWHEKSFYKTVVAAIPSGQHTLVFDYKHSGWKKDRNSKITMDFQADHKYLLFVTFNNIFKPFKYQIIDMGTGNIIAETK